MDLTEREEWREIPGHSGLYEVSNIGRVRSVRYYSRKILGNGGSKFYEYAELHGLGGSRKNQRRKREGIHRLVCKAFNGPPPDESWVCHHKNGDTLDNSPENLEWLPRDENVRIAVIGEINHHAKLNEQAVKVIRWARKTGVDARLLASLHGVRKHCIYDVASGRTWRHVDA